MTSSNQFFRDLKWTIQSPPLMNLSSEGSFQFNFTPSDTDQFPSPVVDEIPRKVGRYFETLVEYWLRDVQQFEIVATGQQIVQNGKTRGELDFIFRDETGELIHLETAIKFYLYYPGKHASGSHFLGPNSRDHFERKLSRLVDFQLPLGQATDPDVTQSVAFVKGRIFYPLHENSSVVLPVGLNAKCLTGWWTNIANIAAIDRFGPDVEFALLSKPFWLSQCDAVDRQLRVFNPEVFTARCRERFLKSEHPVHVAVVDKNGNEIDRGFVVANSWPHA